MKTRSPFAIALIGLLGLVPLIAQSPTTGVPGVPAAVREAMLRGDTKTALEQLDTTAHDAPALADTVLYLRAVALSQAERRKEALDELDKLERTAPKSTWAYKASFLRADLLRLERRFEEAAAIYEAQAKRLSGPARQAELAAVYLKFAEELAAPPSAPNAKPDFARAAELFGRALELAAPDALRERASFRRAQCIEAGNNAFESLKAYETYLAAFDPTNNAHAATGSPNWIFESRLARARAQMKTNSASSARRTLEDLSSDLRKSAAGEGKLGPALRALSGDKLREVLEFDGEAQYALAGTWLLDGQDKRLGIAALERFVERFPAHARALRARLELGEAQVAEHRTEAALATFDAILALPAPDKSPQAKDAAQVAARAQLLKARALSFIDRHEEAKAAYTAYTVNFPTGADWSDAQQGILNSEFAVGMRQRSREEYEAAKHTSIEYLAHHPLDPQAAEILLDIGELDVTIAAQEKTPAAERPTHWRAAVATWREVDSKYAGQDPGRAGRARLRIGQVLGTELGDFEGAIAALRSCAGTPSQAQAQAELGALTEPALSLSIEKAVLTGEPLRAKVKVRNLEKLSVELWRLDLEAYFRKNLTHDNVESLDLDLITAQQKLEVPVAGYARYKSIEQTIDLDVKGPGAWVIAVSSGKLRSSALCLRSDLDLIVKSTPDECMVFVQDMAKSEPAAGVRVLAALGERQGTAAPVVLEGVTDAAGFARFALDPRSTSGKVSVLGLREGNCASSGVSFPVNPVEALLPRAALYTERSAYRPGEVVHWRAIVRGAQGGKLVVEPGRKLELRINDARGRNLSSQTIAQSEFGTVSGDFDLPVTSLLGEWTMTLALDDKSAFNASFTVAEFELVHVELDVDFERQVYYRGEDAVAIIDAHYAHGGPVADSPLSIVLPDGRSSEARTDAEGRARVSFPTREMAQEQLLELSVTLSDEPLTAIAKAWLSFSEFSLSARTARDTYAIDSPFSVRIQARGPDGKGVAKKLKLSTLKISELPGRPRSETQISEVEVSTDASGAAAPVARIAKSGSYIVRVSAKDRFANPVEDQFELEIVGDEDQTTLRLFSDSDVLKAGSDAAIVAMERGQGGLALVTFEAGRVVDWRWMKLTPGSNPIAFPVADALAPGFVLGLAHQGRGKFRQAELEFRVERELDIAIKPRAEVLAPGAEGSIDIEVRDSRGRPVQAEFSLAIVDEALFQLYPERSVDLRALFEWNARGRQLSVDTDSSSTFHYVGSSWEVSGEVLAEAKRVLEDRKWQEQREGAKDLLAKSGPATPAASAPGDALAGLDGAANDEFFAREKIQSGSRGYGGGGAGSETSTSKDKNAGPDPFALNSPTAFWSGAIATDANGKASVKFQAPPTSARWRVTATAAAKDPRAASESASFVTRADFFVELRAPASLIEGDRPQFFARVHNTTNAPIDAELKLVLRGAGVETSLPAGKLVVPPGAKEFAFEGLERGFQPGTLSLALEASAEIAGKRVEARDARSLTVQAWGVQFSATKSGELSSNARLDLELPADRKYTNLSLELYVGASLDAVLIDEALGVRRWTSFRGPADDGAAQACDLIGSAEVLAQLAKSGRDSSSDFARLRERVQQMAASLIAAQDPGQGWRSRWNNTEQHAEQTAWTMLALAAARDAGIPVGADSSQAGLASLDRMQRSAASDERKALIQHALCRWQRGDYGALNRLHRMRNELSNAALAHTALALVAMDRLPMASEIAGVIESRNVFDSAHPELGGCWSVDKNLPWSRSKVGTAALCVLALEATSPKSEKLKSGVQYLGAHRPWNDPRWSGLALAAVARHAGLSAPQNERFEVSAAIAGGAPQTLDLAKGGSLSLPIDSASGGKLRVDLALRGRGAPHYVAILRGFSADASERSAHPFTLTDRYVMAPAPLWRGKPVAVGFSTVRNRKEQWWNRVLHLARGASANSIVTLQRDSGRSDESEGDWLVLEVPIPAGARVKPGSVSGQIAGSQILADRVIAYIPPDTYWCGLNFTLEGAIPGHYRAGPAVLRNASDPEQISIGRAGEFDILSSASAAADPYRDTPDELYALGMAAWKAGENDRAREWLSKLMKEFQKDLIDDNSDSPLQQAASALFFLALEQNDAREVVRWFELLREKRPDLVIPFDKILAVAKSYSTIDEHERALSILRASVEQTFGVDLKVAGALESGGDTSQALTLLARLWNEYPDAPAVLQTWLALSDKLLTLAPKAGGDKSLVRDARDRASLHLEGTRLLQMFLCLYPKDPQAPEAALNLIAAHLGLEDYKTASSLARTFSERFTAPEFVDAFLYSRAVAEWYLGNDEEAMRVCERVAAAVYPDAKGVDQPSKNRELAQYILAQIHHARREVERAAEYYAKVEQSFADAKAALGELRAKSLSMTEVTRAKPGETVHLALRSKNVAEVELAIYPVDLMTLYLREGDLSKVAQVDLSGIAPEISRTMKLDGANALREAEQKLDLALAKTGAYLVIARGGELFASGLILISELELDVTEDAARGGVRVQVVDSRDGKYVREVDVRVVGSGDKKIQRAKTDLRGMVSMDSVQGIATVIARADGERYAFYRGTNQLGSVRAAGKKLKGEEKAVEQLGQEAYLSNVNRLNEASQSFRAGRLVEEIGRQRLGVQINQVK